MQNQSRAPPRPQSINALQGDKSVRQNHLDPSQRHLRGDRYATSQGRRNDISSRGVRRLPTGFEAPVGRYRIKMDTAGPPVLETPPFRLKKIKLPEAANHQSVGETRPTAQPFKPKSPIQRLDRAELDRLLNSASSSPRKPQSSSKPPSLAPHKDTFSSGSSDRLLQQSFPPQQTPPRTSQLGVKCSYCGSGSHKSDACWSRPTVTAIKRTPPSRGGSLTDAAEAWIQKNAGKTQSTAQIQYERDERGRFLEPDRRRSRFD